MDDNPVLVFYNPPQQKGGSDIYFLDIIKFLKKLNFNVTILFPQNSREILDDYNGIKFEKITLNTVHFEIKYNRILAFLIRPLLMIYDIYILKKFLKKRHKLVIVVNGGYPGSLTALSMNIAARIASLKNILIILSTPANINIIKPMEFLYDYIVNKSVSKVIVNSDFQKQALSKIRRFEKKKIEILYNGINPPKIIRNKIVNDKIKIGYLGRIDETKGLQLVLDTIKKFESEIDFIIAGEGSYLRKLIEEVENKKISNVFFPGYIVNKSELFNEIDLFLFPSLWEGFPYSIVEALGYEIPIISNNCGGISEFIIHNKTGYLINILNPNELEVGLMKYLRDPLYFKSLAGNGKIIFNKELTFDNMMNKFAEILKKN